MPQRTPLPILAALLGLLLLSAPNHADATTKPNVLFIISDDLNDTLSASGHPECKTPHLDAFAKTAVSFSRAYCQFPLCGPSRASIMSGRYPAANGVLSNRTTINPDHAETRNTLHQRLLQRIKRASE